VHVAFLSGFPVTILHAFLTLKLVTISGDFFLSETAESALELAQPPTRKMPLNAFLRDKAVEG
jgi:hypothetical protein